MGIPEIIAEGAQEVLNLFLQHDTTLNGRVNAAVDLSTATAVEVHLRSHATQVETVYSTIDANSKVTIVDATGSSNTINGVAASLVTLTLVAGDISKADEGFDVFVVVKDSQGTPFRIPNKENKQLLVLGDFS